MDGEEITAGCQVAKLLDKLYAELLGHMRREERVVSEDLQPQSRRHVSHVAAYLAESDDPEGLALELHPDEPATLPFTSLYRAVGLGDVA